MTVFDSSIRAREAAVQRLLFFALLLTDRRDMYQLQVMADVLQNGPMRRIMQRENSPAIAADVWRLFSDEFGVGPRDEVKKHFRVTEGRLTNRHYRSVAYGYLRSKGAIEQESDVDAAVPEVRRMIETSQRRLPSETLALLLDNSSSSSDAFATRLRTAIQENMTYARSDLGEDARQTLTSLASDANVSPFLRNFAQQVNAGLDMGGNSASR